MTLLEALYNLPAMSFTSLSFVFVFLPLCLAAYYLAPRLLRPLTLLVESFCFLALAQPDYILITAVLICVDYALIAGLASHESPRMRRVFLGILTAKTVGLILYFMAAVQLKSQPMPFGILICGISGIDCALEAYRARVPEQRSFIRYAVYCCFFPRLFMGPLTPASAFFEQLERASFKPLAIAEGAGRFVEGLLKLGLLGRALFWLYGALRAFPEAEVSVLSAWCTVLAFALSLYFALSGMTDIARGLADLFGIALPKNFYYPYQSQSVTDFFERFNITYGKFLNGAVVRPFCPDKNAARDVALVLLRGLLWGLWFGLRANYAVWGLLIAAFIVLEKYAYPAALKRVPTLFCRIYTFFVVLCGFAVFEGATLTQGFETLRLMFSFRSQAVALANPRIFYTLSSDWALLLAGAFFATSFISLLVATMLKTAPRFSILLFGALDFAALAAFAALTLGGVAA